MMLMIWGSIPLRPLGFVFLARQASSLAGAAHHSELEGSLSSIWAAVNITVLWGALHSSTAPNSVGTPKKDTNLDNQPLRIRRYSYRQPSLKWDPYFLETKHPQRLRTKQ